jgi:surface carbohydrate biosynthesis protein
MYRILLFSDSKWRDLPGSVLLKLSLQNLLPDAIIEICSFHVWEAAIELFNPHLVVLNHILGRRNKMIASYVKRHGGLVVVQFNEGIIDFDGQANVFKEQRGHKDVDLFLCWNELVSELVDGIVTGCPRFDIYGESYNKLIDSKKLFCDKHNLDASKPLVIFGDSWPSAKFSYSMQAFHKDNWSDLVSSLTNRWDDANSFAQDQYEQQELLKFIIKYATIELRSKAQIVVSTHPMADFNTWQRWGNDNDVYILDREYIFNTLYATDVYISKLGSVSISEAWLVQTHTITLGQGPGTGAALDQYRANYFQTISEEDQYIGVVDLIKDALESDFWVDDVKKDYLHKWGIKSNESARVSAQAMVDLLVDEQPEVVKNNYQDFSLAIAQYDRAHGGKLDSFGNWDKAVTQFDVHTWMRKFLSLG